MLHPKLPIVLRVFQSLPVHCAGEEEYVLSLITNGARIKLLFRHIDPDIHTRTSSTVAEKQGLPPANPPRSQGLSMAQSTYQGSEEAGDRLK